MFPRRSRPLSAALALPLAMLAASCMHVEDDPHSAPPPPPDPFTYEIEPNDFYYGAHGLGWIGVGEQFLVRGHVTDVGTDRFDGFALRSAQPMDVEFRLYADRAGDDFDVELFDPYTLTTVATWETGADPEAGFFSIGGAGVEFHLVVSSFFGTGSYTLEVRGRPLTWFGDESTRLVAEGAFARSGRAVDWAAYAGVREEPDPALPPISAREVQVDPDTGAARTVHVRRIEPEGLH